MAMNTVTAPVRPANPVHDLPPASVIVPDWTDDPRVRRILASFAKTPPPMIDLPRHECWGTQTTAYTGFRVACLRIIRASVLDVVLHAAWLWNDPEALVTIADAVTVDDAVAAAVRVPVLRLVSTTARQLNPAVWGAAA